MPAGTQSPVTWTAREAVPPPWKNGNGEDEKQKLKEGGNRDEGEQAGPRELAMGRSSKSQKTVASSGPFQGSLVLGRLLHGTRMKSETHGVTLMLQRGAFWIPLPACSAVALTAPAITSWLWRSLRMATAPQEPSKTHLLKVP